MFFINIKKCKMNMMSDSMAIPPINDIRIKLVSSLFLQPRRMPMVSPSVPNSLLRYSGKGGDAINRSDSVDLILQNRRSKSSQDTDAWKLGNIKGYHTIHCKQWS